MCNADNVPPIPDGLSTCDTFRICALGETAYIPINFLSPENNQTTSITVNNGGLNSLNVVSNTSGNTANLILEIVGNPADVGIWNITVTATDNATPNPGSTILTFTIVIEDSVVSSLNPLLTPLGGCETVNLSVLNGPYDSYLWDDFSVMANSNVTTSGNYGVTVSRNGCFKRVESYISVGQIPTFDFVGDFQYCGSEPSTSIALADSHNWVQLPGDCRIRRKIPYSVRISLRAFTLLRLRIQPDIVMQILLLPSFNTWRR